MFTPVTAHVTVETEDGIHPEPVGSSDRLIDELKKVQSLDIFEEEGIKSGGADVHSLLVTLASAGAVDSFVKVIGSWLTRDRSRTLKIQIGDRVMEANNLSSTEQQELIRWFQVQAGLRLDR